MTPETLDSRIDRLEQRVTLLEQLPARVDALAGQISQLGNEMPGEFFALRNEIREGGEAVVRTLREEIRANNEAVARTLRQEIRASSSEVLSHARILHEDLISRLAVIQEGKPRRRKR